MYVTGFDFDSTVASVQGLDELDMRSLADDSAGGARFAEFARIADGRMAGEMPAEESLASHPAVLSPDRCLVGEVGLDISRCLTPSLERRLGFFRANAGRTCVLSGGFEELILPTLSRIGIPSTHLLAHRFSYGPAGGVTGLDPGTEMAEGRKPAAIRRVLRDGGPARPVGDGATDLELRTRGLVDRLVTFAENRRQESVVRAADGAADSTEALMGLRPRP